MLLALCVDPLHVEVVVVEDRQAELLRLFHLAGEVHEAPRHSASPQHALVENVPRLVEATDAECCAHCDQHGDEGEVPQAALRERVRVELQRATREEVAHS